MHGQKKRRKRSLAGSAEIEGYPLDWELVSEPQWTTDGPKGLCVSVRLATSVRRELIIEHPYDRTAFLPQRPRLTAAIVENDIRLAMKDGWEPESRGRPYVFLTPTRLELGQRSAERLQCLAE